MTNARSRRARELIASYGGKVKPILVGGSYLDLMKAWRVAVYFDQQGTLTRRSASRQVPALVSQEGQRLRVDEVGLPMNVCRPRCHFVLATLLALTTGLLPALSHAADSLTCTGRFPNPITEICWSCILPISIGSATIANVDGQEDIANPSSPVCSCGVNPTIGLSIGFWEPARHVEAVRKPFCLRVAGRHRSRPGHLGPGGRAFHAGGGRRRRRQLLPGALLREPGPLLAGGGDRLPLPGTGLVRPRLPDRGRSAVERRRADADPQPRGGALREPDRRGGVRRRLRGRHRRVRHCRDVLVRGLPGRHLPLRRPRAVPHGRRPHGGPDRAAPDRQDAPRAAGLGLAWQAGAVRPLLPAGDGQDRLQDPADLPDAQHREGSAAAAASPSAAAPIVWGAGKEYPVRGEDFAFMLFRKRNCCVGY